MRKDTWTVHGPYGETVECTDEQMARLETSKAVAFDNVLDGFMWRDDMYAWEDILAYVEQGTEL